MKIKALLSLAFFSLLFVSCDKNDDEYELVNVATPEYMDIEAFRSSVVIDPPTQIKESGKIYVYNDLVLVGDVGSGIHIIDNSNPLSPEKVAFIKIKANKDMEVKGDYLYADSLMDLVVFDLSDIQNIREAARLESVFPEYIIIPFDQEVVFDYSNQNPDPDDIIVGWEITEERRKREDMNSDPGTDLVAFESTAANAASSSGQGGSLARFKIVNDYLYAVDSHNINIFNISNLESPESTGNVFAGFDIETIFNRGDHLFLGSMRGMYIYDITSPASPELVSEFQHGTACDPVVVDDNYAYITLRGGNFCGALESTLLVVDITDLENPGLTASYPMDNPYGLGIKDNLLFICDGSSGLKVYDKTNVEDLELIDHFTDIDTYDVIPLEERLLMIGDNVLFQYEYSDEGIDLLSQFSLN